MCGPKFCSMKVHTHLGEKGEVPITEAADPKLVDESLRIARALALPRTGSVAPAQALPVALGKKPKSEQPKATA
jgi:hypothetical protein